MCLAPAVMAALQLATAAAAAAATYQAQSQQANAQADAINSTNAAAQMDAERQASQAREQGAAEVNAHAAQARREMAMFDAVAGEGGAGNTANRAATVASIRNNQDLATVGANQSRQQQEIGFSSIASTTAARQRMAAIQQPSLLQTGLTIASAGVNYGTTMNKLQNPLMRRTAS